MFKVEPFSAVKPAQHEENNSASDMSRISFDLELYRNQMRKFISGRPHEHVFWDALDFATEAHDDQSFSSR